MKILKNLLWLILVFIVLLAVYRTGYYIGRYDEFKRCFLRHDKTLLE